MYVGIINTVRWPKGIDLVHDKIEFHLLLYEILNIFITVSFKYGTLLDFLI